MCMQYLAVARLCRSRVVLCTEDDAFHHKFFVCKLKFTQNGGVLLNLHSLRKRTYPQKISDEENKHADDA